MSILQATSAGVKDMADGCLRITLEFNEVDASAAYALFGKRGTPCGIAALTLESTQSAAQEETIEADKPKGGFISQWCAMRCNEPQFWEFLAMKAYRGVSKVTTSSECNSLLKTFLGISSKTELDNDPDAQERYHQLIRLPYQKWLAGAR